MKGSATARPFPSRPVPAKPNQDLCDEVHIIPNRFPRHQCCAIKGACDGVELGNLTALLDEIEPAIDAVSTPVGTDRSLANIEFVNDVVETNVRMQVNELLRRSDVIRKLAETGQVKVVGAVHDISTGEVTFL